MRRFALLTATAAFALLTAPLVSPASAGEVMTGGVPLLFNQNIGTANNAAIGTKNTANQMVQGTQNLWGGYYGGHAKDGVKGGDDDKGGHKGGQPEYKGGHKGGGYTAKPSYPVHPYGMNSNLGSATNLALGEHNTANQQVQAIQNGRPKALNNSNIGSVFNGAIGFGNTANQVILGQQN